MNSSAKKINFGLIITVVLFVCIIAAVVISASAAGTGSSAQGLAAVRRSLSRAVVECYSLEGAYPPSLEYIEQYYGVRVNPDKYFVNYNFVGDNMMPIITVAVKG